MNLLVRTIVMIAVKDFDKKGSEESGGTGLI
jgi:hypothetical protein